MRASQASKYSKEMLVETNGVFDFKKIYVMVNENVFCVCIYPCISLHVHLNVYFTREIPEPENISIKHGSSNGIQVVVETFLEHRNNLQL